MLVVYDVPQTRASERERLRRFLRERGFGYLQNSVWISPDPLSDERELLSKTAVDVEALILLEARPCAGETDRQLVGGAWNFERLNEAYEDYLALLEKRPEGSLDEAGGAAGLQEWWRQERVAWSKLMELDPLLPEPLLPEGYLGMEAWRARRAAMKDIGVRVRDFRKSR